jgi:acetyltransferase-like isoleucine patch superfamily enzyme
MDKIILTIFSITFNSRFFKKIKRLYHRALLPKFKNIGHDTNIQFPFNCEEGYAVEIGSGCRIGKGCDFRVMKIDGKDGNIKLGNYVSITARCQIYSALSVILEDYVMIAANVFIIDSTHKYSDANIPYTLQGFDSLKEVIIGKGSWIGQNVVITQGVKIGKQCIIGSNSVVTKSIPEKCIAVGSPAKVIKVWDEVLKTWVKPIEM